MKKILSGILASTMILSTMGASFALEVVQGEELQAIEVETLTSGTCGDNATWTFDSATGTMTISGTGYVWNTFKNNTALKPSVKKLVIGSGITIIGGDQFNDCTSLTTVDFGDTVEEVWIGCFANCTALTTVYFGKTMNRFALGVFYNCNKLQNVYFTGSQSERSYVDIYGDNEYLESATWHYNSYTAPTTPEPELTMPSWAESFISYAIDSGILPNISASNMDSASNRGLISQALYNLAGEGADISASHSFNDTGDYAQAIAWCYENGLMSGMGDTEFGTNSNVTREQFALILRALAQYQGKDVSGDTSVLSQFSDQSSMNTWAMEGIAWAVNAGLMQGNDGKLDPQGSVTQVQVAVMMYNFANL